MPKIGKRILMCASAIIVFSCAFAFLLPGCMYHSGLKDAFLTEADPQQSEIELLITLPEESTLTETSPTEGATIAYQDTQNPAELPAFTVIFYGVDGTILSTQPVEQGSAAIPPEIAPPNGYEFVGWDTDYSNVRSDLSVNALFNLTAPAFAIETASANAGEENVAITVKIVNNPGVASVGLVVEYDEELTLSKIEYNEGLAGQFMLPQHLASPTKLTWISPFENVAEDCVLATLYFSVPKDAETGRYEVSLQYDPEDIYDIGENNLDFMVVSGGILVIS